MTRSHFFWAGLAACALSLPVPAQEWTAEDLDDRILGFLEDSPTARLDQIGKLIAVEDQAARAIAARIHGDHREYLLKVQRLIGQLTDERWLERERAERTLVEIGGRARELLRQRSTTGKLLEERKRCKRILDRIDARGTEKEVQEIQMLRGLVATAFYLKPHERLTRALLSALGHTDNQVVEAAVRALGVHGQGDHARAVHRLLEKNPGLRGVVLTSLARMEGDEALSLCRKMVLGSPLNVTEAVMLIRMLRLRADAKPLLDELSRHNDPVVAAAAGLKMPTEAGRPIPAGLTFADGSMIQEGFLGLRGDGVLVESPVGGLRAVEVAFSECDVLEFKPAGAAIPAAVARVFLTQGTLVTGELVGMKDDRLVVKSSVWGTVEIPCSEVQGIALDPALDRLIGASTKIDRVRLRDQKLLDGKIVEISAKEVVMRGPDGGQLQVPMRDVAGILFTRPLQSPVDNSLYTRLDLAQGDRILGHVCGTDPGHIGVVAPTLGSAIVPMKDVARVELVVSGGALWGFTLIADYSDNRLVEVDEQGKEIFVMEEVYGAWDVECLDSGNLLITEFSVSRVQEVTRKGEMVWSFEDLRNPYDADRLPNGNTLIADTFRGRVIEVNSKGEVVWQYDKGIRPFDVDRLPNGNTLIADVLKERVIEVSPDGKTVWEKKNLPSVHDADRLPNGNTLITLRTLNRVIEVDRSGKEVFRLGQLSAPSDADRLPNGHTIVAENNMVREFDRKGSLVWRKEMTWAVEVNRY